MTGASTNRPVEWIDDHQVKIGATTFLTLGEERIMTPRFHEISDQTSTPERFVLQKPRTMVEAYLATVSALAPKTILEFGIFKGGSVAMLSEVAHPHKYVAIELAAERVGALDEWIGSRSLESSVKPYYGVSQDDEARVREIVDAEFGGMEIDLIIDDASHAFAETRTTFNLMFPRLRAGGVYLIEDWALAGYLGLYSEGQRPLADLLGQITTAWSKNPDLFAELTANWFVAAIRRGDALVDEPFDIAAAAEGLAIAPRAGA